MFQNHHFLVSRCRNFCGDSFNVSEKLRYRKNLCKIGVITICHPKFLVSEYQKISRGNRFVFQKNSGLKKNYG